MEYLSDQHLESLIEKEWLVKVDNPNSTPYLMKFHASATERTCWLMVTDTKTVWGEVLSSKLFARRWRECNPTTSGPAPPEGLDDETEWKEQILDFLLGLHGIGGIKDLIFEVVESRRADLTFELRSTNFKWRWETYNQGPKISANVISQQLVLPLISLNHLAFSTAESMSELSEDNLEKVIDKAGRTGRRTIAHHLKNALARPRLATSIRRMSAMFNFLPDMPPIVSQVEPFERDVPIFRPKTPPLTAALSRAKSRRSISPGPSARTSGASQQPVNDLIPNNDDSATEDEEDHLPHDQAADEPSANNPAQDVGSSGSRQRAGKTHSRQPSPQATTPERAPRKKSGPTSESSSSSPVRPSKKSKRSRMPSESEDSDSEAERKRRLAQIKSGSSRGPKQPIKRGGKRF
ncbi:hypothetical protein QCA50_005902 [Cerrena zonata]|uniref:XLF-like N-terminal domain-containing protein n=1 Tax=Cerrena zonata TaxID=2478898 RepID=A0AAW0GEB4_9APHY